MMAMASLRDCSSPLDAPVPALTSTGQFYEMFHGFSMLARLGRGILLIVSHAARPFLMMLSNCGSGFVVGIQPVTHQRLHNQAWVAEMLGGVFLKLSPEFCIEAVSPLLGFGFAYTFGFIAREFCGCHSQINIHLLCLSCKTAKNTKILLAANCASESLTVPTQPPIHRIMNLQSEEEDKNPIENKKCFDFNCDNK
jgi:hypothetical protein